jgi:hypothetical protein
VAILTAVVDAVDTAVANNDNLCALRDRAIDLLEVIAESCAELQVSGAYARIISALTDALREICDYARAYGQRSVLAKLLFGFGHRERFEDLSGQLAELTRDATFALSTKTATRVAGMVGRLQAATAYVVSSAELGSRYSSKQSAPHSDRRGDPPIHLTRSHSAAPHSQPSCRTRRPR